MWLVTIRCLIRMLAIQLKRCLGYSSNQPPPAEMPQFPAFSDGSKASIGQAGTAVFYRFLCETNSKLHSSVPEDVLSWLTHPIGESLMDKFETWLSTVGEGFSPNTVTHPYTCHSSPKCCNLSRKVLITPCGRCWSDHSPLALPEITKHLPPIPHVITSKGLTLAAFILTRLGDDSRWRASPWTGWFGY